MPNYCLNCAAQAGYRCACCEHSHYCSRDCQRKDYEQVHKYERDFLSPLQKKGLAAEGGGGGATVREPERPARAEPAPRDKRIAALRAQLAETRREYQETMARVTEASKAAHQANREKDANARLTHKQREEKLFRARMMFPSRAERARATREAFTLQMLELVQEFEPLRLPGAPRAPFGEAEELALTAIFRANDVLEAKLTLGTVARSAPLLEEAMEYKARVTDAQKRFVHSLLLGDAVAYEEVVAQDRERVTAAAVKETVNELWRRVTEQTVQTIADHLIRQESAGGGGPMDLGFPPIFGAAEDADRGEMDKNTAAMMAQFQAEQSGQLADSAYSLAQCTSHGQALVGTYEAQMEYLAAQGRISEESRDESVGFVQRAWRDMHRRITSVANSTRKKVAAEVRSARDAIQARVEAAGKWVREKLSLSTVARVILILSLLTFALFCLGIYSQSCSAKGDLDAAIAKANEAIAKNSEQLSTVNEMGANIAAEKEVVAGFVLENTKGVTDFLAMDITNSNLDDVRNRAIINSSIDRFAAVNAQELADLDPSKAENAGAREFVEGLQRGIDSFRGAPTAETRRAALKLVQKTYSTLGRVADRSGVAVGKAQYDLVVGRFGQFLQVMGVNVDKLREGCDEMRTKLSTMSVDLVNGREKLNTTEIGSPGTVTFLKRWGYEGLLDTSLLHPLWDVAADQWFYSVKAQQAVRATQFIAQLDHRMFALLGALSGIASSGVWSYQFFSGVANALFNWDHGLLITLAHALSGLVAALDFGRALKDSILAVPGAGTAISALVARIGAFVGPNVNWLADKLGYGALSEESEERLRELMDDLKRDDGLDDAGRAQSLYEKYSASEITPAEYGRLIAMLYNQGDGGGEVQSGNAMLSRYGGMLTDWVDGGLRPAYVLSQSVSFLYNIGSWINFFWHLLWIVTYLSTCLAYTSIVIGAIVLGLALFNYAREKVRGAGWREAFWRLEPLTYLLTPFNLFLRFTFQYPEAMKIVVRFLYTLFSTADAAKNALSWAALKEERAEENVDRVANTVTTVAQGRENMEALLQGQAVLGAEVAIKVADLGKTNTNYSSTTNEISDLVMRTPGKSVSAVVEMIDSATALLTVSV